MLALANKLSLNTRPIYRFVNKYSIDFDGVDDRIVTDGADTVAQNTTYSMWIKSSTTTENFGVFGHGSTNIGAFHLNSNDLYPMLYLGSNYWIKWNDNSAQDDGEWHHYVVYLATNLTDSKLYIDGVLQTKNTTLSSGSLSAYTQSLTIGSDRQVSGNSFEGKIDEFAVYDRELTQDEITRMYNTYYSPNRVANGNFAQIGNEEVTNGDFSQIGSEEVTNGDFATDSDWIKGTGWTISGGTANAISQGSFVNLQQSNVVQSGKTYEVTFTISNYVTGEAQPLVGGISVVGDGTSRSGNGSYTEYIKSDGTTFYIRGRSFTGSIDNVSVKEVGQDWSLVGDFEIDDTKAFITSASQYSQITSQQGTSFLTNGKTYKLEADITTSITNALAYRVQGGAVTPISTSDIVGGKYTAYFTMTQDGYFWFQTTGAYTGLNATIDNVSVKEVGQHWTFGSSWSTNGTEAIFTTGSGTVIESPIGLIGNRTYRVSCVVTGSQLNLYMGTNTTAIPVTTGTYNANIVTASNTNGTIGFLNNGGGASGTLDNIVVQELKHDATNLMLNAGAYQSANPLITSTKSMEFDGSDDYLQLSEPFSYTNHTVCAWINRDTISATNEIFSARDTTSDGIDLMTRSSGKIRYRVNGNSLDSNNNATEANKWAFVTGTYDGTTAKLYINGVLNVSSSISETISTTTNVKIGKVSFSNDNHFNGKITEVGAFNRALTSLEVASLYNQGMPTNLLVNRNNYQSGNPTVFNTKQVDFDGTDDKLVFNTPSAFSGLGLNSFDCTLSAWAKFDTIGVFEALVSLGTYDLEIAPLNATDVGIWVDNAGLSTTYTPTMGEWNHYVATKSGNTYSLYVDGVLIGSDTDSDNATIGTQSFIGNNGFSNYFDGDISQVGLWNSTLTANEVSSLYNHGLPIDLTTDQAAYESSSNLVGYWRMGSGTLDTYPLIADQTNATLGSELVTNGDFELNSGWLNFGSPTTSEQSTEQSHTGTYSWKIIADATQEGIFSPNNFNLTSGLTYSVSLWIYSVSGNSIKSGLTNTNVSVFAERTVTVGEWTNITYIATASSTGAAYVSILSQNSLNFFVDDVSIKQVNGNPAIMTNQTSSDIENGSPYANIVQNGDFSEGSTDWTITSDWTLGTNKVTFDDTSTNYIAQNSPSIVNGKKYKIQFTVLDCPSTANIQIYNRSHNTIFIANENWSNGTYTRYFTSTVDSSGYAIWGNANLDTFALTNIIIEEVNTGLQGYWKMGDGTNDEYPVIYDQTNPTNGAEEIVNGDFATDSGWTKGTGWSISNGKANATDAPFGSQLIDSTTLVASKIYKISFDISNYVKGIIRIAVGNVFSNEVSSNGSYTFYLKTANTNAFKFQIRGGGSGTTLSVDNVSVKEVQGNPATMTNMVEGNITNQYPLTKIRNYYRMGDGILDGYPIIQDQTSPNLAHIPTTNLLPYSEDFSQWTALDCSITSGFTAPDGSNTAYKVSDNGAPNGLLYYSGVSAADQARTIYARTVSGTGTAQLTSHNANTNNIFNLTEDWQRFEVNTTTNVATIFYAIDFRGSGTLSEVLLWGAQTEEQLQATAYIKSDGIAAVRKATTTNLIEYSEDFTESGYGWNYSSNALELTESNSIISPDGTQSADKISKTAVRTYAYAFRAETIISGQPYSWSVFMKKGTHDIGFLSLGQGDTNYQAYFDLTNGTSGMFTGSANTNIEDVGNGWFRCSLQGVFSTTDVSVRFNFGMSYSTSNVYWPSASEGAGLYAYFWGAQLEEQTQAETYAKTTGLPVTIDLFTENNYGTMTNQSSSDIVEDTP